MECVPRECASCDSLVAALCERHVLEGERLLVADRWRTFPILPDRDVTEALVVALRLPFLRLMLDAEVAAGRLVALERVERHELTELEEVGDPACVLERLVQRRAAARHTHIAPELLAQLRNPVQQQLEAVGGAGHAAVLPHEPAELAVEIGDAAVAVDGEQRLLTADDLRLRVAEGRVRRVALRWLRGGQDRKSGGEGAE